jgi:lysophospholipase L1-like esterase
VGRDGGRSSERGGALGGTAELNSQDETKTAEVGVGGGLRARGMRLGLAVLAGVGAFLAWQIGPVWLGVAAGWLTIHRTPILFLSIFEKAYLIVALGAIVATAVLTWRVVVQRKRRRRVAPATARALLAAGATLFALILAEVVAGCWLAWTHRVPSLPTTFAAAEPPLNLPTQFDPEPGSRDEIDVVVIGESSAQGVPFEKWMSVGEIVGWRLREVFPGRKVRVDVMAKAGSRLIAMHQALASITRRPDILIIYAGHNEFYARHAWTHEVTPYYDDDPVAIPIVTIGEMAARVSPLVRLIEETLEARKVAAPPPLKGRRLIDAPSHSVEEHAELRADFLSRLNAIVAYCEQIGATPVLVAPPGNDVGFEPDRSVLPPETPRARREVFAQAFEAARRLESSDPAQSTAAYRALVDRYPGFAESHFRLARRLDAEGRDAEAYEHYVAARDLDAHPMRCLTSFQDAYRELAKKWNTILVDGQALFHARHPRGLLDDHLFNDGFHPSFEGHVALAEAILAGLKERKVLGWPDSVPAPTIDLAECAANFGVGVEAWKTACQSAVGFYHLTGSLRFDSTERSAKRDRYNEALRGLIEGKKVEDLGVPGLGLRSVRELKPTPIKP